MALRARERRQGFITGGRAVGAQERRAGGVQTATGITAANLQFELRSRF
jgi:hypothetical protein